MIILGTVLLYIYEFFAHVLNYFFINQSTDIVKIINSDEILECGKLCCMSFNVHNFYSSYWKNNLQVIIDYINNSNCDVICLQEVQFNIYDLVKNKYKNMIKINDQVILTNHQISDFELYHHPKIPFRKQIFTPLITLSITMNNQQTDVLVGNLHFNNDFLINEQHDNLKQIINKFENENRKIILMGDTNIPSLKNKLNGFQTYMGPNNYPSICPYLQLDRFFCKNISLNNYNCSKKIDYSDHLPIYAEFN